MEKINHDYRWVDDDDQLLDLNYCVQHLFGL
jgi:hypothetical protein